MMLAELIKRVDPKAKNTEIINNFQENKSKPYSIHEIVRVSYKDYSGRVGQFWSPLTAMLCLKDLFMDHMGRNNMIQFCHFNNNSISFKEFEKGSFGLDEWTYLDEYKNEMKTEEVLSEKKLVYFTALLGDDNIHPENFQALSMLLSLSSSLGFLSGVDTRAYYVIGMLFLDPHTTTVGLS